jgi:hypothetical protein
MTEYLIKDEQGIIFGVFSQKEDRDYALRKFVKTGFPSEEK